jgi:hypothetical protein
MKTCGSSTGAAWGAELKKTNQTNNSIKVRQISCAKCACSVWRIGGYSKI